MNDSTIARTWHNEQQAARHGQRSRGKKKRKTLRKRKQPSKAQRKGINFLKKIIGISSYSSRNLQLFPSLKNWTQGTFKSLHELKDGNIAVIWNAENNNNQQFKAAQISVQSTDVSDGTEDANFQIATVRNGTQTNGLFIEDGGF